MPNKYKDYKLNLSQFEYALSILNNEKQASIFSRFNRINFKVQMQSLIIIGIFILFMLYLTIFDNLQDLLYNEEEPRSILISLFMIFGIMATISSWIFPISFLIGVPFLLKIYNYNRRIKELGLKGVLIKPWREEIKKNRILNIVDNITKLLGFLVILGCSMFYLRMYLEFDDDSGDNAIIFITLYLIYVSFIGISLISISFVRRSKSRIKIIDRLHKSLLTYKGQLIEADGHEALIPIEDYELIAEIERAQIARQQAKSILEFSNNIKNSNYTIQKSKNFKESVGSLSQSLRLAVDEQIDKLLNNLDFIRSNENSNSEIFNLIIPDQPMRLIYQVDFKVNRIKIIALEEINNDLIV